MTEKPKEDQKKRKDRSPNYPGIDLETALDKARILREKEGKHYAPVETVRQHWGYLPKSSGGLIALSALRKYGLIEEQGKGSDRRVKLSDLALAILLDDREDSIEKKRALQEAALNPPIHRKLWEEFGGELPSHENLLVRLRKDEGFTDNAAEDLIREFERTIIFAGLNKSDILSSERQEKANIEEKKKENFMSNLQVALGQKKPIIEIPIPLSPQELVTIKAPYPLDEAQWNRMITILTAYKPSLVPETKPEDENKEN